MMPSERSDERPWAYRCRFTNWLIAKPWKGYHYRTIYRHMRREARHPRTGKLLAGGEAHGRLRALWLTLTFPHVHHYSEDIEVLASSQGQGSG